MRVSKPENVGTLDETSAGTAVPAAAAGAEAESLAT